MEILLIPPQSLAISQFHMVKFWILFLCRCLLVQDRVTPMNKSTRLLAIEAENRKFLRADTRRIRRDWAPWRWIGRPCGRWHRPPRTCWGKSTRSPREALAGRAQRRVG